MKFPTTLPSLLFCALSCVLFASQALAGGSGLPKELESKEDPFGPMEPARIYTVFQDTPLFWHHKLAAEKREASDSVTWNHMGDVVSNTILLPKLHGESRHRIEAVISYKAIHKAGNKAMKIRGKIERLVVDPWDRLAWVLVKTPQGKSFELLRFITGFGGNNSYVVDLSHLAPILQGEVTIEAHIDNFAGTPAWTISVDLVVIPDEKALKLKAMFCQQIIPKIRFQSDKHPEKSTLTRTFTLPKNVDQVALAYITTGHGKDEFVRRTHRIKVNGKVVMEKAPWRDDCRNFLDKNPFTGVWRGRSGEILRSSDFPRSNWCPSDQVPPILINLKDCLKATEANVFKATEANKIELSILFPSNYKGGYWPTSAYIFGTLKP